MDAVLPLARIARYSDVRKTAVESVLPILHGMFDRIIVGLNAACSALDDSAAEEMLESIARTQEALDILNDGALISDWEVQIHRLLTSEVHGLIRGWACRLLLEKNEIGTEELERLTRLELSPVTETSVAASWLTGLLKGSGLLLIHQEILWQILDEWLQRLQNELFVELLPVLRRAFSGFTGSERRQMGEKVKQLKQGTKETRDSGRLNKSDNVDHERAAKVLPVLAEIMGVRQ